MKASDFMADKCGKLVQCKPTDEVGLKRLEGMTDALLAAHSGIERRLVPAAMMEGTFPIGRFVGLALCPGCLKQAVQHCEELTAVARDLLALAEAQKKADDKV